MRHVWPGVFFVFVLFCPAALRAQETPAPVQTPAIPSQTPAQTPTTTEAPTTPGQAPALPPPVPAEVPATGGQNLDAPAGPARPTSQGPLADARAARERQQAAAPPPRTGGGKLLYIDHADRSEYSDVEDARYLEGDVRFRYEGYTVTADRATWRRSREEVTLEGNVTVTTARQTVFADFVRVNTRTREFFTRDGRTIIYPDQIGQGIVQPVRISGQTYEQLGRNYRATVGFLTTCDFPNPHYKIGFRQADIIPNNRIVLRDSVLYRYEKPVARIKYLVIPIREEVRYSYLPYAGRTEEEGYFVKNALGYTLGRFLPGLLRVDYMQKKGIGLGFDQAYQYAGIAAGTFLLYSLRDRNRGVNNLNGRVNHQQYIGDTLGSFTTDFQNNSYQSVSADSKTAASTLTLARSAGGRQSNASISRNTSSTTGTKTENTSYNLSESERFGATGNVTLRLNGSQNGNSSTIAGTDASTTTESGRREQTGELRATGKLGIFDGELQANKSLALRQTGANAAAAFFSGTQRLPELNLTTDGDRLGGFLRGSGTRFTFGYGRFLENVTRTVSGTSEVGAVTTTRSLFATDLAPAPISLSPGSSWSLNLNGRFRQTYYRSDAAQYVLDARPALIKRLGRNSSYNLAYSYLRPYGGTPQDFRLDETGSNNNLASSLTIDGYRTKLSFVTGYDIMRARAHNLPAGTRRLPWRNAAIQLALRPSDVLQTRVTTTYDINTGKLLDLTHRLRIRSNTGFALDTGTRYDPVRYRFPLSTVVLTTPLFGKDLNALIQTSYNGIANRFEYKNFGLTQSFHDYDLVLTYINQPYGTRTEKGFSLSVRLRALPAQRTFQAGQYGTALDTGLGDVF